MLSVNVCIVFKKFVSLTYIINLCNKIELPTQYFLQSIITMLHKIISSHLTKLFNNYNIYYDFKS